MLDSILSVLLLPCLGIGIVFIVYMCLFWYVTFHHSSYVRQTLKPVADKGLSLLELEKFPKITGKELVTDTTECAVCLDKIECDQLARLIPGCSHIFHLKCADTWLSKHPFCPVCRAKVDPQIFDNQNPC